MIEEEIVKVPEILGSSAGMRTRPPPPKGAPTCASRAENSGRPGAHWRRRRAARALLVRADIIFFSHALFRPLDGDVVVAGVAIHPAVILVGPLAQNIFGDGAGLVQVAKEMDDIFRPGQQGNVPQDDDAVETAVYKSQQAANSFVKVPSVLPGDLLAT